MLKSIKTEILQFYSLKPLMQESKDFIQKYNSSVAITLSGPNYYDLTLAKSCIKKLLLISYHLYLEKEIIIVD